MITDTQILALAPIVFPMVVSLCVYLYNRFVPPSKQAQLAHASSVVGVVVNGVEQACVAMNGPDKKAEATRLINQLLAESKLKVSPTLVDSLIEDAVYAINQKQGNALASTQVVPVVKP